MILISTADATSPDADVLQVDQPLEVTDEILAKVQVSQIESSIVTSQSIEYNNTFS